MVKVVVRPNRRCTGNELRQLMIIYLSIGQQISFIIYYHANCCATRNCFYPVSHLYRDNSVLQSAIAKLPYAIGSKRPK